MAGPAVDPGRRTGGPDRRAATTHARVLGRRPGEVEAMVEVLARVEGAGPLGLDVVSLDERERKC